MKKFSLTCFLLLALGMFAASPALALDTLGVADTTGISGGVFGYNGVHCVGWKSSAGLIFHTGSTDTVLSMAYSMIHAMSTGGACTTVVSIYDSTTGTLQACSDQIIWGSLAAGWYPDSASISGYLRSNTAYKVGVQVVGDLDGYGGYPANRALGSNAGWGDVRRLTGQGLNCPANLSSHTDYNWVKYYGFVTLTSGGGEPPEVISDLRRKREEARR
jgi:hypothetical protein